MIDGSDLHLLLSTLDRTAPFPIQHLHRSGTGAPIWVIIRIGFLGPLYYTINKDITMGSIQRAVRQRLCQPTWTDPWPRNAACANCLLPIPISIPALPWCPVKNAGLLEQNSKELIRESKEETWDTVCSNFGIALARPVVT